MPITLIEIAIQADDIDEDAVPALAAIVDALGLSEHDHIDSYIGSTESGDPVLLATLQAAQEITPT